MDTDLLETLWTAVTDTVEPLPEGLFGRPTRTDWTIRELLFHQLLDAQRALVALASPTEEPADVDAVTYWHDFRPSQGDGGAGHAEFVRRAAAAYDVSASLVGHWSTTAEACVRAARAADPQARVRTQGHVIAVPDLVSTLVVEATVHLLDLTLQGPGGPPPAAALAGSRRVLEELYGGPLPAGWDDTEAVLRGTGRLPVDDPALPLLG
jgi:hypothetical protein